MGGSALADITAQMPESKPHLTQEPDQSAVSMNKMGSMLPSALAKIEHDASPASAAGFERSIETLTHMARNAVRFDRVTSGQAGTPTAQDMPR
jgi:hypothetical protein